MLLFDEYPMTSGIAAKFNYIHLNFDQHCVQKLKSCLNYLFGEEIVYRPKNQVKNFDSKLFDTF